MDTVHNGSAFGCDGCDYLSDTPVILNCGVPWYGDPLALHDKGSIVLYLIGVIWLCIGMRVVSDDYFAVA